MCTILTCADGTVMESCGDLRKQGYRVAFDYAANGVILNLDDDCMCNIDVQAVLLQQPDRQWEWDPFGYTEAVHK